MGLSFQYSFSKWSHATYVYWFQSVNVSGFLKPVLVNRFSKPVAKLALVMFSTAVFNPVLRVEGVRVCRLLLEICTCACKSCSMEGRSECV